MHLAPVRFWLSALSSGCSVLLFTLSAAAAGGSETSLFGFLPDQSPAQQSLEHQFDAAIDPADLAAWVKRMASAPNHVGSAHDKANAEFVRDQFRSWGWTADIESFDVLYPTLIRHSLEMFAPVRYTAQLQEPAIPGDTSSQRNDGLAPYNVYGADGDITGELVYVNYGMQSDYKELARRGIDVKGRIAMARYGAGWRGLKAKLAEEHGAIGCILYSDPQQDGYGQGDVYPKGGWRPAAGVQRGSVADITLYSGDPLTPGVGATPQAHRLSRSEAASLRRIPVLPISYADAQPLLQALEGRVAPATWRGALPITYHLGPGPARVHLVVKSDWSQKPLYDVIAKIAGTDSPDAWVMRGNHRDGWVFGAWDPLSGHAAMMAEAKAIGALLKTGWKPRRTLVYASWDGEEPGLLGSTEWAETHAQELQAKTVLYLNSDENSRGFLSAAGSHSLRRLVDDVAFDIKDPETGVSVERRLQARLRVEGYGTDATEEQRRSAKQAARDEDLPLDALGSGSDFTPFLQHLGLTTLDIGYGGESDQAGVYHSKYDTFEHFIRFGDPQFRYGVAEARTAGHVILRMAQAPVLPLQFQGLSDAVDSYVAEIHKLADDKRRKTAELDTLLDQDAFTLATDPTRPLLPPAREPEVPYLELAPLDNAAARLKQTSQLYDGRYARWLAGGAALSGTDLQHINALLQGAEQALVDAQGLPGRPWYRHLLYAPGAQTGYGAKTLPGVREAIEDNRWADAEKYAQLTADALNRYSEVIDQAAGLLPASVDSAAGRGAPTGINTSEK
jgi:N-acetylated-alpha-linked acidic dipeptidase